MKLKIEIPVQHPHNSTVVVLTGNGKGKTTAATGMIVRAAGADQRAALVTFDKGTDPPENDTLLYSERAALRLLPHVQIHAFGCNRMMPDGGFRYTNASEDFEQAAAACDCTTELIRTCAADLIVCDEILSCVSVGLLQPSDVDNLIAQLRQTDTATHTTIVLTGRTTVWDKLFQSCDIISEIAAIKHHHAIKTPARKGLDF